ncbi:hypothetical protein IMCC21906_03265 (plasmid) [Spongiibacter sp. IMCC21906]|uniref:hypothetical protein n=1 Tax=Spongiibacter sp. IMCC21906 TaxID=1620392 RepID=UPI00062E077B|nr:hypothetical protein [Spongiibacter sp. IMCC21906]AKH70902.1 hypothetical protein IMCC21906_03265 [Spongiibacter sp. IMCC21906]
MNGIAQAILAATPLAGLVLYFALSGQQEVKVEQKRYDVGHEIQQKEFDLEFQEMRQAIAGSSSSEEDLARWEEKSHQIEQDLASLREDKADIDSTYDVSFQQKEVELKQLRAALEMDKEAAR